MIYIRNAEYHKSNFPDGTLNIHVPKVSDSICNIVWKYESDAEIFELQCIVDNIKKQGSEVILSLPYIPNARMDRIKDVTEVFSLKSFAKILNNMGFKAISVADPHSQAASLLIDNMIVTQPIQNAFHFEGFPKFDMYFFPDEGAHKKYAEFLTDKPYAFGIKDRDWTTGQIRGLDIYGESVQGKEVLIVDDICSKGGTFYHSAIKLREMGAKNINLWVTHCENSITEGELLKTDFINKIFTTNSICSVEDPKLTIYKIW